MFDNLKLSLKLGAYGGIVAVFVSLIGMVEAFGEREIVGGVISLGHMLLVINGLVLGYLTAHLSEKALNPPGTTEQKLPLGGAIGGGALAGLTAGVSLALLLVITDRFNIREVLINASPTLVELLTFGQPVMAGAVRLAVFGIALGVLGSALFVVPGSIRRPVVWGLMWVTVLGMLADLLRIMLTRPGWPNTLSKFLIVTQGLSPRGAGVLFVAVVVLVSIWRFLPGVFERVVTVLLTGLPKWLRGALVGLITASLAVRLIWFIGIDQKDLALLPDCRDMEASGFAMLSECVRNVGAGIGSLSGLDEATFVASAPFLSALISAIELIFLLGILASVVVLLLHGVRWAQADSEARARPAPGQVQAASRFATLYISLAILAFLPLLVGVFPSEVMVNIGLYVLMGFGINIVVGFAGLLDLGYVAFFAVGAYSMALLTSPLSGLLNLLIEKLPFLEAAPLPLSFWSALPFVFFITAIAGVLVGLPVLRMRGDYLAIVTLGFGEIARFLALSDWLRPYLGGAQGILNIPNPTIGRLELIGPQMLYYLVLVGGAVALFVSWRLQGSRVGRALVAMREDEDVANAMGINTIYYKLLAFAMGASIASFSGAIFATKLGAIFPHSFNVIVSITALSLLIIGGIGSLPGVVVGAVALVGVPELLREFSEYRLFLYGAVLIVMMIVRPEGLLPSVRRARELHAEELSQDDWLKIAGAEAAPTSTGAAD